MPSTAKAGGIISVQNVLISSDPTSNRIALQNAAQACADNGYALFIPAGAWPAVDGGVTTTNVFSIYGVGPASQLTTSGNDALFKMAPTYGGLTPQIQCGDFSAINTIASTSQKASSVIEIASSDAYVLYPLFERITSTGFYTLIKNTCGVKNGRFGDESLMNWATFESLRAYNHSSAVTNAKYCVWHTRGSGTGGTYRDLKGEIDASDVRSPEVVGNPAYVRVDGGVGVVTSDMLFDGHITGANAACVSIDGDMNYCANICISDLTQIDASATGALVFDPPASAAIALQITPKNIGGNIDIARGLPVLLSSTLEAQGRQYAHGGCAPPPAAVPAGPNTKKICARQMQHGHTPMIDKDVSGGGGGVAAGAIKKHYSVKHTGSSVVVTDITALGYSDPSPAPTNFFNIVSTVTSDVVVFELVFNAGAANSRVAYQYEARGGGFLAKRGYFPV